MGSVASVVTTAAVEQIWTIHSATAGQAPRVEYLSTLEKHQSTVNVVRWSPNGLSCSALHSPASPR